jgi:hypothetical protein
MGGMLLQKKENITENTITTYLTRHATLCSVYILLYNSPQKISVGMNVSSAQNTEYQRHDSTACPSGMCNRQVSG